MHTPTDNIPKPGHYERLAQHMRKANARRKGLCEILRRVHNVRAFEQVLNSISQRAA